MSLILKKKLRFVLEVSGVVFVEHAIIGHLEIACIHLRTQKLLLFAGNLAIQLKVYMYTYHMCSTVN